MSAGVGGNGDGRAGSGNGAQDPPHGRLIGIGSGLAAGSLWGLVFLAPELAYGFTPLQMSVGRYLAYGAFALALLAPQWRRRVAPLRRADWMNLLWLSLVGNVAYYVMLVAAVRWAGVAATSLIIGLLPVVVTVVGSREKGATPLASLVPALLLGATGVALIGVQALRREGPTDVGHGIWDRFLGLGAAAGALAAWSAYAVGNSRALERLPDVSARDWSLLTGVVTGGLAAILSVPAFLFDAPVHPGHDWLRFWSVSAAVALGASIIGNAFWNRASRHLPLTMIGQMIIFETLFALLYGFIWRHCLPTALEVGATVALVASVLASASRHRASQPAPS